jgi:hypothetical protein
MLAMGLFRKKKTGPADEEATQQAQELLDRDHHRASVIDGDRFLLDPGQVLDNITEAMERIDIDVDTAVAIEDFASAEELWSIVQMGGAATLAVHVVNTAARITGARYPADLAFTPLPSHYDLRKLIDWVKLTDEQHDTACVIFNQRLASKKDFTEEDVREHLDKVEDDVAQLQVFNALFFIYGTRVGALKYRTGIE